MGMRICLGVALWACALIAVAAGPASVRKQVESSMLVAGTVDIEPDGSVSGHELNQPEKLPKGVVQLIGTSISGWRFEPVLVAGRVVKARANMSVRVVAKKIDKDKLTIEVRNAHFGTEEPDAEHVRPLKMTPPQYPNGAIQYGINGVVYLVLRIGRQGTVEDAITEQVNLRVIGSEHQMRRGRDLLASAALAAARRWTFKLPTSGETVDEPYWSVRVPVDFAFSDDGQAMAYGKWETYVPGPRETAPWAEEQTPSSDDPDAMAAGGVYPLGKGPRLLTPLGSG